MALQMMLDDRLYRLADLQEFWLLDAFEVAVIFLVFASLHTCPLDTSVQLAVRSNGLHVHFLDILDKLDGFGRNLRSHS